jgi:SAM-dependent methyltransferase
MASPDDVNADMKAFWDGHGGQTWVTRQAHTDRTLLEVTDALVAFAAPETGERVLDVGCGCGAPTLEIARAVGSSGTVSALDISRSMLAEAAARAQAAGLSNIRWKHEDPATADLDEYDLMASAFGTMFFGDPVSAFANMRRAAAPGARLAMACWRSLPENPWVEVPMNAVAQHLPPRPAPAARAPGMFAFADPGYVADIMAASGWASPHFEKLDLDLDIAAGRGLDEAIVQMTQIGAINSWLRDKSAEVITSAVASMREALEPHSTGESVRLPGAMWLVSGRVA